MLLAVNRQMKRKDDFVPPGQGHLEVLAPVLVLHTLCAHSHGMNSSSSLMNKIKNLFCLY